MINKRKLKTFSYNDSKLNFGDYILFQKYDEDIYDCKEDKFKVSKPILAIYLGCFVADQALGFNYVRWNNDQHIVRITNEHVTNYPTCKEVEKIESHIEWRDYIDILGHWTNKPTWKEILKEYRKQYSNDIISSSMFDV